MDISGGRGAKYRRNLQIFTKILGEGMDAHHMFPKAEAFANFFKKMGVDVNNPALMKWMESSTHRGKFSSEYNKLWSKFITRYGDKSFTIEQLMEKAKEFEKQAMKIVE